ncbi:conserved Plasmodium protein, unknown function [Plasmodium ovale wallikeri]|uniref:RAP domain-containing protein n=2 Tax=Plasmodium ovale TaxID=36330 RepID=A0A1A8YVA8_PLAOA|nr:conserved Plasmodium protein, unknown function [Plasmodium ovale wallikeri]SBT35488.1 conserved Plasmodium protein, unknown function [Plasmodium ovale wallikeri]SBT77024.1 conserved Plasmodium protein, unknown function [Plasmodium ovale]
MIVLYRSNLFRWMKQNEKGFLFKKHLYSGNTPHYVFKKSYVSVLTHGEKLSNDGKQHSNSSDSGSVEVVGIAEHIKNQYNIHSHAVNLNIERSSEEEGIYEISSRWSHFFNCEKSLYNVINRYIKTNETDCYLHSFLKGTSYNEMKQRQELGKKDELESCTHVQRNDDPWDHIEEDIKNVLVYIMALFYKNVRDFNIISMLSEKLMIFLKKLNKNYTNKNLIFTICEVYNYVRAMNDVLFTILFDLLNNFYIEAKHDNAIITDGEIVLILKTLYYQKYKNHPIVDTIVMFIKKTPMLNPQVSVNSFFYLTLLSRMDHTLAEKIHSELFGVSWGGTEKKQVGSDKVGRSQMKIDETNVFPAETGKVCDDTFDVELYANKKPPQEIETVDEQYSPEANNVHLKIEISTKECAKLLYAYFVLGEDYINWFSIHRLLLQLYDNLKDEKNICSLKNEKSNIHEMLCIIRTYLRYKKRNFYDTLPKYVKKMLKMVSTMLDIDEKKIKERKFNEKLSWHLKKLRIPHMQNVFKGGILFDILEKDKKLVWLCFSYHHYYVKTIDLIAEKLMQIDIIKSMHYKIAHIHYYQFSRMKARRTRFEYIRMCRYYSLRDRRNFDDQFEGWNLPYINWYHKKNKNVHISNYFYNYTPISEMEY